MVTTATMPAEALVRVKNKGYYKDPASGDKYTSVTTILDRNVAKNHLVYWAGNTVARCALDNLPYLVRATRVLAERLEAYEWLSRAHKRKKEERGEIGGAVHSAIEARILGTTLPPEIGEDPEMQPYLKHFEAFVRDYKVTFTASEMIVANSEHMYGGTLDCLLTSPVLAEEFGIDPKLEISEDTKTGGELDVKGVYPEAALQMAAYSHATFAQLRTGERVPMPPVADQGIVLHLRPEGYRVIPVRVDDDVFAAFLRLRHHDADWTTGLAKTVLGPALNLTKTEA
jgi:hypothetical protein